MKERVASSLTGFRVSRLLVGAARFLARARAVPALVPCPLLPRHLPILLVLSRFHRFLVPILD